MDRQALITKLNDWVLKNDNNIKQRSPESLEIKKFTIGGSSIASIQGVNPNNNICKLVRAMAGGDHIVANIYMQLGNLFEQIIRQYVEMDRACTIVGNDMFIYGPPNITYSPDGLTVMDVVTSNTENEIVVTKDGVDYTEISFDTVREPKIILCEFKCPYMRIPRNKPPVYYVSQVKMGLDVLNIADMGLLIEAVFRRCTWDQLGNNIVFDKTLVSYAPRCQNILAFGIIGFYAKEKCDILEKLSEKYDAVYGEKGDKNNDYFCNDLGAAPPELFTGIIDAYD